MTQIVDTAPAIKAAGLSVVRPKVKAAVRIGKIVANPTNVTKTGMETTATRDWLFQDALLHEYKSKRSKKKSSFSSTDGLLCYVDQQVNMISSLIVKLTFTIEKVQD